MSRIESVLKREDWLRHVSAWRTSGLTQAAYCRELPRHLMAGFTWTGGTVSNTAADHRTRCHSLRQASSCNDCVAPCFAT